MRQAAALYIYDNTLYVVQMEEAQLKKALDHAASVFSQWPLPLTGGIKRGRKLENDAARGSRCDRTCSGFKYTSSLTK
jgi:hypothetical protein